jgi:hypothetical protein
MKLDLLIIKPLTGTLLCSNPCYITFTRVFSMLDFPITYIYESVFDQKCNAYYIHFRITGKVFRRSEIRP